MRPPSASGWPRIASRAGAQAAEASRGSGTVAAALAAGLPASGAAGLRFALEPGHGRTAVPVRSVIAGTVLAVFVGIATLTFGASLSTLISHPSLYGWNFSYALYSVDGYGPVPSRWAAPLLARDPRRRRHHRRLFRDRPDRWPDGPGHGRPRPRGNRAELADRRMP